VASPDRASRHRDSRTRAGGAVRRVVGHHAEDRAQDEEAARISTRISPSPACVPNRASDSARSPMTSSQCFDGIEAGHPPSGIGAREHAEEHRQPSPYRKMRAFMRKSAFGIHRCR
jgi:hypothetical protein